MRTALGVIFCWLAVCYAIAIYLLTSLAFFGLVMK